MSEAYQCDLCQRFVAGRSQSIVAKTVAFGVLRLGARLEVTKSGETKDGSPDLCPECLTTTAMRLLIVYFTEQKIEVSLDEVLKGIAGLWPEKAK